MHERKNQRGSAIPAVLAMTIGVGALASGYVLRNLREHGREAYDRESEQAVYDAWSQMQVATRLVCNSPYDAAGHNMALQAALARPDRQFIDTDGWPTHVTVEPQGGAFFQLVSAASVGGAKTRVTSLCTERESFADFNYFVASQPLGISGGHVDTFPYADAPEGSVHSNDKLVFYFPDRHFRDAVTAVNGFEYTAGARGPGDASGQNNWFHGTTNDHAATIGGLTEVDIASFAARPDNTLALAGDFDYAKVALRGTTAHVEHWQRAHTELQTVLVWQQQFHSETQTRTVYDYGWVDRQVAVVTPIYGDVTVPVYSAVEHHDLVTDAWTETLTVPVYEQQLVTAAWTETVNGTKTVTTTVVDSPAWDETVSTTTLVATLVWVEGGGGGDTGGIGGIGDVGYWDTQMLPVTTTSVVHHDAVTHVETSQVPDTTTVEHPAVYQQVQTGTTTETVDHPAVYDDWTEYVETGTAVERQVVDTQTTYVTQQVWEITGSHEEQAVVQVSDGWTQVPVSQPVTVADHKVADHDVDTHGTVYVKGNIFFVPVTTGPGGSDTQVFDGSMTFASGANVYLQDSIVYGVRDAGGNLQTAFLNGADKSRDYVPNPAYTGAGVLGIVANQDIVYTQELPSETEINATLLAKNGSVRVQGVTVNADGTVSQTSGGWLKLSLRRLGGMITNWRPVSSYVDGSNAVTRGFIFAKSRFDARQRVMPPLGFPTLSRPRMVATLVKELN